jgi:hypothetical protein
MTRAKSNGLKISAVVGIIGTVIVLGKIGWSASKQEEAQNQNIGFNKERYLGLKKVVDDGFKEQKRFNIRFEDKIDRLLER